MSKYIGSYKNDYLSLANDLIRNISNDVLFLCIGTDRSTGDSFAPFVGSMMMSKGYNNVIGTIDNPIHGMNIESIIKNQLSMQEK